MTKFRLLLDKDKETAWLNKLASEGWALKSFFLGFYKFEKCEPGEYVYQIDIQDQCGKVSEDYREFMTEAGIEIVQVWGFWVILRKKASEGEFVLYTDVDSQIEHYKKILKLFKIFTIVELICFIIEVVSAANSHSYLVFGFVFLIAAIVIVFLRIIAKTKNIINELEERKTGIPVERRKGASPFLSIGLLFNSVALIAHDSISNYILLPIQICAIVLMLVGIVLTLKTSITSAVKNEE